jgi:hypothetical protein
LAGAAEDFSRAIALQPEFAQQYLDRATVYERLGRHRSRSKTGQQHAGSNVQPR